MRDRGREEGGAGDGGAEDEAIVAALRRHLADADESLSDPQSEAVPGGLWFPDGDEMRYAPDELVLDAMAGLPDPPELADDEGGATL